MENFAWWQVTKPFWNIRTNKYDYYDLTTHQEDPVQLCFIYYIILLNSTIQVILNKQKNKK